MPIELSNLRPLPVPNAFNLVLYKHSAALKLINSYSIKQKFTSSNSANECLVDAFYLSARKR